MSAPRALILGCAGPVLGLEEGALFRDADPLGFILFARNCQAPDQVRALTAALRAAVGRADAPVLIDQEGGRVQRLKPPGWRQAPPAAAFGARYRGDPATGLAAARLNARLIADDLAALGIDVDCLPVLDLPVPGAHDVIGDRAFGRDPAMVTALGRAVAEGLLDGGVLPVIKHMPGHGRSMDDSHLNLPVVEAGLAELTTTDFAPFRALADLPLAMVAHLVFRVVDPQRPASVSPEVIGRVVRGMIGFDGLLLTDDLGMQALSGDMGARVGAALAAGCDVGLHCSGDLAEMQAAIAAAPTMTEVSMRRWQRARARLKPPLPFQRQAALAELERLLG